MPALPDKVREQVQGWGIAVALVLTIQITINQIAQGERLTVLEKGLCGGVISGANTKVN